jgi:uncharacterized FAD-dependent dehydrogenase
VNNKTTIIIVGAGPAGLFAALELIKQGKGQGITIVEQGNSIETRKQTEAMAGVGGAGTFSDGKLHFTPVLSHEKLFLKFGVTAEVTPANMDEAEKLVEECKKMEVKLYIRKCRHVGSDKLPGVVKNMVDYLKKMGVKVISEIKVEEVLAKNNKIIGLKTNKGIMKADNYLLCPGRIGAKWLQDQMKKLKIEYTPEKIEIGVRVEFPAKVMARHSKILHENIYSIVTPTFGDVVRTFCPCPNGSVAVEDYLEYVCVNGFSNSDMASKNSNFNFTCPVILTEPTENTTEYATLIAKLSTLLGSGKPQLQRLGDLKSGHRSTWEKLKGNKVTPSLNKVIPGDISLSMPYRLVKNILEGLEILNRVLPGINDDSTLLYAPEIKLRGSRVKVNRRMQTSFSNLFVAGDGAGLSGNIVGAAVSGIFAAKGIMSE